MNRISIISLLTLLMCLISACNNSDNSDKAFLKNKSNGLIAYYSKPNGNKDIYVMNPDGANVRQITQKTPLIIYVLNGHLMDQKSFLNQIVTEILKYIS